MNALEVQNLCVDLGNFRLDNVSFNIKRGAVTGLVGANGAGKTTLIKTIMRQLQAKSGKILYWGKSFAGNEKEILTSCACVFDDIIFSKQVKPKKIVKIYKDLYPNFNAELYEALMNKFHLPQDIRVGKYSFGMQKKLNFILGLCQGADTLILDEPTSGVDPFDRNEVVTLLQEFMLNENHTVLFSTHITEDLDKIADYIIMLDGGKIALDCDKETLTETYRIVRAQTMTPEMEACAIGLKSDMFGYTFLTKNTKLEGEGMQSRVPTVEEIFVHIVGNGKPAAGDDYKNIFGI